MSKHRHFIIHKPYGYLSQFVNNQNRRRNKKLLGELYDFPEGTMAIGRLDQDSEGLLLLTTDGKVSELVRSKKVEKEYLVRLDGIINDKAISSLKNGVDISLDNGIYRTQTCTASILNAAPLVKERSKKIRDERHGPTSWITMTIREGKFRQVRKMTAVVGFPTLRLIRVRIGNVCLRELEVGHVTEVEKFIL